MRKIPQPSSSGSHVLYSGKGNVEFKQLERKHHLLEKKKKSKDYVPDEGTRQNPRKTTK